jgi:hypothetical protein
MEVNISKVISILVCEMGQTPQNVQPLSELLNPTNFLNWIHLNEYLELQK